MTTFLLLCFALFGAVPVGFALGCFATGIRAKAAEAERDRYKERLGRLKANLRYAQKELH